MRTPDRDGRFDVLTTFFAPMSSFLPFLPTSFSSLAAYYAPYNQRLYQWMKDTKADASPHEPSFQVHPVPRQRPSIPLNPRF